MRDQTCYTPTETRESLAQIVRGVRKSGEPIRVGQSPKTAMSEFRPLPEEPGEGIELIDMEKLRRRFSTIRGEVENTGAIYQVAIRGEPAVQFGPTRRATRTKIAWAQTRLFGAQLDQRLSGVEGLLSEVKIALDEQQQKLDELLPFVRAWRREWRNEHGLPARAPESEAWKE